MTSSLLTPRGPILINRVQPYTLDSILDLTPENRAVFIPLFGTSDLDQIVYWLGQNQLFIKEDQELINDSSLQKFLSYDVNQLRQALITSGLPAQNMSMSVAIRTIIAGARAFNKLYFRNIPSNTPQILPPQIGASTSAVRILTPSLIPIPGLTSSLTPSLIPTPALTPSLIPTQVAVTPQVNLPIPAKYPVPQTLYFNTIIIEQRRRAIYDLVLKNYFGGNPNPPHPTIPALNEFFRQYDAVFFDGQVSKYMEATGTTVDFEISDRLSRVAGKCIKNHRCSYIIRIADSLIEKVNEVDDIACTTRLHCVQLLFEHEVTHLLIQMFGPLKISKDAVYKSHGELFRQLVRAYFGHAGIYYKTAPPLLAGNASVLSTKDNFQIGDKVTFGYKGIFLTGRITKKNPIKAKVQVDYTPSPGIKTGSWSVVYAHMTRT